MRQNVKPISRGMRVLSDWPYEVCLGGGQLSLQRNTSKHLNVTNPIQRQRQNRTKIQSNRIQRPGRGTRSDGSVRVPVRNISPTLGKEPSLLHPFTPPHSAPPPLPPVHPPILSPRPPLPPLSSNHIAPWVTMSGVMINACLLLDLTKLRWQPNL